MFLIQDVKTDFRGCKHLPVFTHLQSPGDGFAEHTPCRQLHHLTVPPAAAKPLRNGSLQPCSASVPGCALPASYLQKSKGKKKKKKKSCLDTAILVNAAKHRAPWKGLCNINRAHEGGVPARQPACRAASLPGPATASAGRSGSCCSERSWPRHSALGTPSLGEEGFGWESSCSPRSAPLQTSTGPFWSERGCSDMSAFCKHGHTSPVKHSKPRNRESCQGWGEQRPAWIGADGSSTAPATRKHPHVRGNLAMAAWDLPL